MSIFRTFQIIQPGSMVIFEPDRGVAAFHGLLNQKTLQRFVFEKEIKHLSCGSSVNPYDCEVIL